MAEPARKKAKKGKRLIVINATDSPIYAVETFEGKRLKKLQELVNGNITIIPHKKYYEAAYVAYANDEGFSMDLPSNFLAWSILRKLGFNTRGTLIPCAYLGNIVIGSTNEERGLTDKQIAEIVSIIEEVAKEDFKDVEDVEK